MTPLNDTAVDPAAASVAALLATPEGRRQAVDAFAHAIEEVTGIDVSAFPASTPLADLGLDSLSLSEVLVVVEEHLGGELPESVLASAVDLPDDPALADVWVWLDDDAPAGPA